MSDYILPHVALKKVKMFERFKALVFGNMPILSTEKNFRQKYVLLQQALECEVPKQIVKVLNARIYTTDLDYLGAIEKTVNYCLLTNKTDLLMNVLHEENQGKNKSVHGLLSLQKRKSVGFNQLVLQLMAQKSPDQLETFARAMMEKDSRITPDEIFHVLCQATGIKNHVYEQWLSHVSVNAVNLEDEKSRPPLYYAISNNANELVHLLLKNGADLHYVTPDGINLLSHAYMAGNSNMFDYCLEQGIDYRTLSKKWSYSPESISLLEKIRFDNDFQTLTELIASGLKESASDKVDMLIKDFKEQKYHACGAWIVSGVCLKTRNSMGESVQSLIEQDPALLAHIDEYIQVRQKIELKESLDKKLVKKPLKQRSKKL